MHIYANPKRFLSLASWLTPLLFFSGLALVAGVVGYGLAPDLPEFVKSMGIAPVPEDRLMGKTVSILFIHVHAGW